MSQLSGAQAFDQSDLPDDDPEVVAGMERLKLLRAWVWASAVDRA